MNRAESYLKPFQIHAFFVSAVLRVLRSIYLRASMMQYFAKIVNAQKPLTIFYKMFHHRYFVWKYQVDNNHQYLFKL